MTRTPLFATRALTVATLPLLFGFTDCGGALFSETEAPSMEGDWAITYDDVVSVEIAIGGAVYTSELGVEGGVVDVEVDGEPVSFALDCASESITCPSEVWAPLVTLEHRDPDYPNRVWLPTEQLVCDGETVEPTAEECGDDTDNPDCEPVCDGEMVTEEVAAFGLISEAGDEFAMLLGGGVATNGVNCAMLGVSVAEGDLTTSGGVLRDDPWVADAVLGQISVAYAGACLWADDVDGDEDLEAAVLGARLTFRTGFDAARIDGELAAR